MGLLLQASILPLLGPYLQRLLLREGVIEAESGAAHEAWEDGSREAVAGKPALHQLHRGSAGWVTEGGGEAVGVRNWER